MPERAERAAAWTRVALGDVVRQVKDRVDPEQSGLERYIAGEHMDTDDLRLRRWGEIGDGYLGPAFHMRFKPGHVLYGSRRTYLRKVAVADFEGITANTTYVLEPKDPNVLLPGLLPFIMQTEAFNQHSVRESKGSVNPYVNFSDLAWYEFALPPIEEQRRIVALCRAANAAIERTADCRQSCEQVISAIRMSRFDPHRFKPVPLSQLCDDGLGIQIGPFGAQLHQADYEPVGVPVVMPLNMKDDRVVEDGIARVSETKARSLGPHRVREGDILLPRRGELDRRALVTGKSEGWLCGTGSIRVRLLSPTSPLAVLNALASPHCLRWLKANAVGTTMPNLNTTIVGSIPIVLPPKEMLGSTLAALAMLDAERELLCGRLQALGRVRQALAGDALEYS